MNSLYFGDNLEVIRESIKDESVDLVYLDPPFNSKRDYNLLFKSPEGTESNAQITAFEDSWHWGQQAVHEFQEVVQGNNTSVAELLIALKGFLGTNDMMAYLTMMANRLLELQRVLKPTGCLYLHCDPTASHYLKLVLDGVFGVENYRNEIVWQRTNVHSDSKTWSKVSDTIFFYTKGPDFTWNPIYQAHSDEHVASKYGNSEADGRKYTLSDMTSPNPRPNMMYEWKGFPFPAMGWRYSKETMAKLDSEGRIWYPTDKTKRPRLKRYLDEMSGTLLGNVWTDINPINSQAQERLGYPTQKPLALLERIIQASSNPGDVVLDPFCGCGTAVDASQKLGRQWIGIDITHLAVSLIEKRMKDRYPGIKFEVHGTPKDLAGAMDLSVRDKYQFQWWACSLVDAQPFGGKKKGADGGIDGLIYFGDIAGGKEVTQKAVVSVKGGNTNVSHIRDLKGVMERDKAAIGLFVTLEKPSKPMLKEAADAGEFKAGNGKLYPRLQVLSIEDLFDGKRAQMPDMAMGTLTFKKAVQHKAKGNEAPSLFGDEG
jgi:site-specific DNA-methyltransferase (adenine-specific)